MRRRLRKISGPNEPSLLLRGRIPLTSLLQTLAVAEYLNFRHAANALGISQSSVSARVKALEEDLGILLFERRSRGVRLTEAGRHFVEQIAVGIDQLDHAVRTAGTLARGEQGIVRIGVHAMVSTGFLTDLLSRFRDLLPSVDVEIVEGSAIETLMQVRDARLDIAFVAGAPSTSECHSRPLWTETFVAVVPTGHSLASREGVAWHDLAAETFLVRHGGDGVFIRDHICQRLVGRESPRPILRFNVDRLTLMSMVAQGYGVTLASESTAQIQFPGVTFLPLIDEPEPVIFSAVWSPGNRSPVLRAFLDLAQKTSHLAPAG